MRKKHSICSMCFIVMLVLLLVMTLYIQPANADIGPDISTTLDNTIVLPTTDISGRFTDTEFRQAVWEWLGKSGTPGKITMKDIENRLPAQGYSLSVNNKDITSLAGLRYFVGLKKLDCSDAQLTSLPPLPTTLEKLLCFRNQLTSIPPLPNGLKILDCFSNPLNSLPALPNGLTYLDCYDCNQSILPNIPNTLTSLVCSSNQLSDLPNLPSGLKSLDYSDNPLVSPPALPNGLTSLSCSSNMLQNLPVLPNTLKYLKCIENQLISLPTLPNGLVNLDCGSNMLQNLPVLPDTLKYLKCNDNQLRSLPTLPDIINNVECQNNRLTNLPNLPNKLFHFYCEYNYLNVFSDPLKTKITSFSTVDKRYTPQFRLSYTGGDIQLAQGATKQQSANIFKIQNTSNNTTWGNVGNADLSKLTFASSNNAIATVDTTGNITGRSEGTCSIYALLGGIDSAFTKTTMSVTISKQADNGYNSFSDKITVPEITVPDDSIKPGGINTGNDTDSEGGNSLDSNQPQQPEEEQQQYGFNDSSASSWAVGELEKAEQYGLVTEKVKNNLKQDITREEFCGIAVKLYEALTVKQAVPSVVNPFNDTSDIEILKAYELGIVKGVSADRFAPNKSITRQEICVMIYRAIQASNPELDFNVSGVSTFADEEQIASWAIREVRYAFKNNIMKGIGENCINPLDNTSREQGIVLIKRTYDAFANK